MNNEGIISVYPNTAGFGFVVLNIQGEILDFGIVSVRPTNNIKCIKKIKRIITFYKPKILIVEDTQDGYKSTRIKMLIKKICEGELNDIQIFKYSRRQIKNTFELFGAKNKFEISAKISEAYPELVNKLPEKRKLWEPENYYQGIFDAMSLVLTHYYLTE